MKLSGKISNLQQNQLLFSLPFIFLFMSLSQACGLLFVYLGFCLGFFLCPFYCINFLFFSSQSCGFRELEWQQPLWLSYHCKISNWWRGAIKVTTRVYQLAFGICCASMAMHSCLPSKRNTQVCHVCNPSELSSLKHAVMATSFHSAFFISRIAPLQRGFIPWKG